MIVRVSSTTSTPSGSQTFTSPRKQLISSATSNDSKEASRMSSLTVPRIELTDSRGGTTQLPPRSFVLSAATMLLLP